MTFRNKLVALILLSFVLGVSLGIVFGELL